MDVNARVYQKALKALGSVNGQETAPKRKNNEDTARQVAKVSRPSTFAIEPLVLRQLAGGTC